MDLIHTPQLLSAAIMHKRLGPPVNQFNYRGYYAVLPLASLAAGASPLPKRRFGLLSFMPSDHGAKHGEDLEGWLRDILTRYTLNDCVEHITLVCMPRVLGYAFNPVSFWLCFDAKQQLRAVLCEVNNTFGETHHYLCLHPDHRPIMADDWLEAEKLFHVSPFLPTEGSYRFRFAVGGGGKQLGFWIDYHDATGSKALLTSMTGSLQPLTKRSLRWAFWSHPLLTFKVIALIHWQALKLWRKGYRYLVKPKQNATILSATKPSVEADQPPASNLTKE